MCKHLYYLFPFRFLSLPVSDNDTLYYVRYDDVRSIIDTLSIIDSTHVPRVIIIIIIDIDIILFIAFVMTNV